jgi:hypothetical protein
MVDIHYKGYILSRGALRKFVEEGLPKYFNSSRALQMAENQGEDIELAMVLKSVGIQAEDTRDEGGAERFFQYSPEFTLSPHTVKTDFIARNFWGFKGASLTIR